MSNTRLPVKHPNTINDANELLMTESQSSSNTQIYQQLSTIPECPKQNLKTNTIVEEKDKDQIEADKEMLKLVLGCYLPDIIEENQLPRCLKTHKIEAIKDGLDKKMNADTKAKKVIIAAVNDYFEKQFPLKKHSR